MNLPTKITFARIASIAVVIVVLFILYLIPDWQTIELGNTGINLVFFIVFIFFVIACLSDYLDGYLARKNHQVTDLGKFIDPVADKLLINSLVIFLIAPSIFAPYVPNADTVLSFNMWCAMLLIVRDIIVDALRLIAAKKDIVIAANGFGKLKTVLQMIAIGGILLNGFPFNYFDSGWPKGLHIVDILVYLATAASLFSGAVYIVQNKHVLSDDKK